MVVYGPSTHSQYFIPSQLLKNFASVINFSQSTKTVHQFFSYKWLNAQILIIEPKCLMLALIIVATFVVGGEGDRTRKMGGSSRELAVVKPRWEGDFSLYVISCILVF